MAYQITETSKLRFENVGMGIALASDYFEVNGRRVWVDFTSVSEGRGQRRKWTVRANHYRTAPHADPVRVTITKRDCFRYEAAEAALAELATHI